MARHLKLGTMDLKHYRMLTYSGVDRGAKQEGTPEVPDVHLAVGVHSVKERLVQFLLVQSQFSPDERGELPLATTVELPAEVRPSVVDQLFSSRNDVVFLGRLVSPFDSVEHRRPDHRVQDQCHDEAKR